MNSIGIKSRTRIKEALVSLMNEMAFGDITIQALSMEGDISRRTFYRHYTSKEEVLNDIIDELFNNYADSISDHGMVKLPDVTEMFFKYWYEHREFLDLIDRNNMIYLFLESLNEYIPVIYNRLKGQVELCDEDALEYILSFSIGGHFNTFMLWIRNGTTISPETIKAYIKQGIVFNQ